MEISGSDNSDNDKRMMSSFESFFDIAEKKDKKNKKSNKKLPIFEIVTDDKQDLLDLRKIARSQAKSARVGSGLTEGEVAIATSREDRPLPAEMNWSGDGGALRKSSLPKTPRFQGESTQVTEVIRYDDEEIAQESSKQSEQEDKSKNLEKLTNNEQRFVIEQYVQARTEDVKQELDQLEPDSPEEAAVVANAMLLENIQEGLDGDEEINEDLLDKILVDTMNDLDIAEETEDDRPVTVNPIAVSASAPPSSLGVPPISILSESDVVAPAPNAMDTSPKVLPLRHQRVGDVLTGGIVGYLIGRRRGRIKTEKRLLPIQEKLTKEVKNLQISISDREEKIRKLAPLTIKHKPGIARPVLTDRLDTHRENKQEKRTENRLPVKAERLAKMVLPKMEVLPIAAQEAPKKTETMSLIELLEVAKHMESGGVSVKQMYEAGRLDTIGLRRVVREFLSGNRFETILIDSLHRQDSQEHLRHSKSGTSPSDKTVFARSDSLWERGVLGKSSLLQEREISREFNKNDDAAYGSISNQSPHNTSKSMPSAYGANGFGVAPKSSQRSQTLPPAIIIIAVLFGVVIAALLLLR
ncbi:hypothetical protein HY003_03630 [Candidatus Saccharibacteria bacterium]|nr:hypothetical protein [Candidatus Saccharibacteria bacterium]MBI3338363.1 hypothetical protein [Candidatus Saccharibacteria bacterium]